MEPGVANIDGFQCISLEELRKTMKTEGLALVTAEIQIRIRQLIQYNFRLLMVRHPASRASSRIRLTVITTAVIGLNRCLCVLQASKKQKLFLMSWCPDTAKVKKKMLYSSSFDALKKSLVGVQKYIQVSAVFVQ